MPESKGRRNRRDRERERRRSREAAVVTDEERAERAEARAEQRVATRAAAPTRVAARTQPPLPGPGVRITGAMVGIVTMLGAAYMIIAAAVSGSGSSAILSTGAGVVMLGIGTFVVALVIFPRQIRDYFQRRREP
jgi:VIT1/CCC1 family predicted Fe2+/Mn2+ transporter